MATVKNVAEIAKVNVSTVSRYLSGELSVTPETEQRILDAIKQTNYQPNIIAQGLRRGRSRTIVVVAPDIYQPGISGIISGIDRRIQDSRFILITVMTQGSSRRELKILRTLSTMMASGVVLIGHPFGQINSTEMIRDAIGMEPSLVYVSRTFQESNVLEVCPDQLSGMQQITDHLIEKGHRSIGLIVGVNEHPDALIKIRGYKRSLTAHNIEIRDDLILEGFFRPEETRAATDVLLERNVDAIICTSDLMGISALQHLQNKKLSIPDDIAVAGYGGTIWADLVTPKLTTVAVQVEELGQYAAGLLLDEIEGNDLDSNFAIRPVSLRLGESV
ncbi:MAG: LacI family transcriptional regulator [Chloroflexi bacterium]|nr:MAG: LacI family transcriptional regulator [Chloroflexota bacterium]MBL1196435.1 LacI family transcriptional regulator [Chloroflexota bacterium]NOH13730.1 LacI family DNA-binding transcriptional regulator [Chloroflexota bacterium]